MRLAARCGSSANRSRRWASLDLLVVVAERLPLGRLGDGGHAPFLESGPYDSGKCGYRGACTVCARCSGQYVSESRTEVDARWRHGDRCPHAGARRPTSRPSARAARGPSGSPPRCRARSSLWSSASSSSRRPPRLGRQRRACRPCSLIGGIVVGWVVIAWLLRRFVPWIWVRVGCPLRDRGGDRRHRRPALLRRHGRQHKLVTGPVQDASEAAPPAPRRPAARAGRPGTRRAPASSGASTTPPAVAASIIRQPDGSYVLRFANFDIEGAPDPVVYVQEGENRENPGGTDLGGLRGNVGTTSDYELPSGTAARAGLDRARVVPGVRRADRQRHPDRRLREWPGPEGG